MSTTSTNHQTHHFTPKGFGATDLNRSVSEIRNFRIMSDGSIMKRSGFKKLTTLPGTPSYFDIFNIDSSEVGLAVVGNKVFEVDLENGECTEYYGTLDAEPKDCSIVSYKENMLIFDGTRTKLIKDKTVEPLEGYAPLYGKDWHPIAGGPVNEPLNLASNKYRVSYVLSADTEKIRLPWNAISIDAAEIDGNALIETDYSFNSDTKYVSSYLFANDGGIITFWVTFNNSSYMEANLCTQATAVSSGKNSVIFCYGRTDNFGIYCYRSTPLSEEKFLESKPTYNQIDLYIPSGSGISVGNGDNVVRSVLPFDERVIIFTDHDAWFIPISGESDIPAPLNRSVGCSSPYSAVYFGDSPVTVCHDRLFMWTPKLDPHNPLSAVSLKDPLGLLNAETNMPPKIFVNVYENELWIFNGNDEVTVFNSECKCFFKFDGFSPSFVFDFGGKLGFVEGSDVFIFDPQAGCDERSSEAKENISAVYTSGWTKIDDTGKVKHADRLILEALTGSDGKISVSLLYNNGKSDNVSFSPKEDPDAPQIFVRRLPHSRFREVRFKITADGESSERIFDVALEATVNDCNQY